jgi:hypothetical protein
VTKATKVNSRASAATCVHQLPLIRCAHHCSSDLRDLKEADRERSGFDRESHGPLGDDFRLTLWRRLDGCSVLPAVIGRWMPADEWSKGDSVRRGIAAALERGIRVVPVLVGSASLPPPDRLPEDIKDLASCQYFRIRKHHASRDTEELVQDLSGHR